MKIQEINTDSYISKSKLPDADYVINPYIGCPHKCIYCYAEFMKRFTGHGGEEWGDFVDIKKCVNPLNIKNIPGSSTVLVGSVTDAYNPLEKKYEITRGIIEQLLPCVFRIEVLTKSDLVVRDIDLFKKMDNLYIGISLTTTNDRFRHQIEPYATSVERRIEALKRLHEEGIHTYVFMSPIFPGLSDCINVIERTAPYVDYICFENLNLRGSYLSRVMDFIQTKYPEHSELFKSIYWNKNMEYWEALKEELDEYCSDRCIKHRFYFYHDQIKKK